MRSGEKISKGKDEEISREKKGNQGWERITKTAKRACLRREGKIWAVGQGTQSHFLHVGRWLLISPSPTRQPLTPMKRGFSVPNDHMARGGDVCGGQRGRGGLLRPVRKDH